ncbi:MAG: 50S ribosomal protein L18 [Oscillospiraceae bacterium]|jgi:large subunit ribosomal protein L18|nr:50S ribosomal protein L18 [Oscillospiraceae bacterium]
MIKNKYKIEARERRRKRIRASIMGTAERPRLNVFRSLKHVYAQIINDDLGKVLAAASSVGKDFVCNGGNKLGARKIGEIIAKRALGAGINQVVFDRGGYLFHGRVKELADGARDGGLKF